MTISDHCLKMQPLCGMAFDTSHSVDLNGNLYDSTKGSDVLEQHMRLIEHVQSLPRRIHQGGTKWCLSWRTHSPQSLAMPLTRWLDSCKASSLSSCSLPAGRPRLQPQSRRASYLSCCRAFLEPQRPNLTEAQQWCLNASAERRDFSIHAQNLALDSAAPGVKAPARREGRPAGWRSCRCKSTAGRKGAPNTAAHACPNPVCHTCLK